MARTICVVLSVLGIGLAAVLSAPSESCSCGKKGSNDATNSTRPKVIKGQDADLNEYPWMVSIGNGPGHGCGAVVINSKWILTAEHCSRSEEKYLAQLGEWDVQNELDTETRKDLDVVNIVPHPDVDMALMEVEGDIDLSIYTPICLPEAGLDVRGKRITLAGWGLRCGAEFGVSCEGIDQTKNIMQEADMPVPTNEECREGNPDYICFGGEEGVSGCHGDSGSPVIYDNNGKWTLVSTTHGPSPGTKDCNGEPGNYGEGAEVAKFLQWIEDNAKGGTSCEG